MKAFASLAAALLMGTAAVAQTNWDMATPYPDSEFHTRNIQQFAQDVSEATGGDLNITVHSGASLFKHPEIKRSVQNQFVPMGEVLMANLFNEDPIFGADNIPFIATTYDEAKALWDAQRPLVEEKLAEDGIRLLYAVPWPGQGFYTNKELTSGSDLEGMRFRTYNATTARMAELMNASPTTIEAVEIPQAFSTGIVDAMVTSGATGVNTKAWDFTDEFYDLQAWMPKNMIIVNEAAFSGLPEEQQQAILDAAAAAETRGWEMSEEVAQSSVATLGENMTVRPVPEALVSALEEVGQTMAQEWAESVGEEAQAILDAVN
ncbi:TRAP transporter substrate-binding protein [Jannaschia formosa]|uniref:TRAP transporter substrate-binding protein n=1 Tax=Jannaschia formosa TaxID=2259592 RepID=UPI000E1B9522|nr:TRAP transporter substrate-binding protein [Jannaschia formosa]TFL16529.1 C4-dicarboxylate ABC transporter substrate-binding protein [Jannaschia formosa]